MNGQGLVFRFATDLEPAKRNLQQFSQHAGTQLALVGGSAVAAARNLEAIGGGAATATNALRTGLTIFSAYKVALYGAAVGATAFAAAVSTAEKALVRLQQISAGSRAAGVDSTFFQVFERQAERLQVKAEDMAAALKRARDQTEMSLGDDGQRKDSPVAALLRANVFEQEGIGSTLRTVSESLDPQERIKAILDQMRQLQETADRLGNHDLRLLSDQLGKLAFGEDIGRKLSEALSRGEMDMARLMATAQQAGSVFSTELVDQAEEVSRRIAEGSNRISDEMKPAIESLAQSLLGVKSLWADILALIADGIGKAKEFAGAAQTAYSFARFLNPLARGIDAITELPGAVGAVRGPASVQQGEAQGPFGGLSTTPFGPVVAGSVLRRLQQQVRQQDSDSAVPMPRARPSGIGKTGKTGSGRSAAEEFDAVETYLSGVEKSIRLLEAEASAIGKNAAERARLVEMAKAEEAARERGTALTPEEIKRTEELAAKKAALTEQIKRQKEAEQGVKDAMSFTGNAMLDAFDAVVMRGEKASEVAANLARQLAKAALQAALLGEGSFAGLMGGKSSGGFMGLLMKGFGFSSGGSGFDNQASLMASGIGDDWLPTFAGGGTLGAGKMGIVGEAGREIVMGPAQIIPPGLTASILSGGGSPNIQNHFHLDGAITEQGVMNMANRAAAQFSSAARRGAVADVFDRDRRYG